MSSVLTSGPVWYLMRGSGIVALLLLTAVVALGIASVNRWRPGRLPRFVTVALHRNVSLLAVVFLVVHVVTAALDPDAAVRVVALLLPLTSGPHALWLGLGALGLDLVLALVVTSVLRRHLGPRLWRGVHWLAYASWPVAFLHGIGMGTDARAGWSIAVDVACLSAVASALAWRLAERRTAADPPKRLAARREKVAA